MYILGIGINSGEVVAGIVIMRFGSDALKTIEAAAQKWVDANESVWKAWLT